MHFSKFPSVCLSLSLGVASLSSCSATQAPSESSVAVVEKTTPKKPQVEISTELLSVTHDDIHFNVVVFDTRQYSLNVADQADGPGEIWKDAQTAAKAEGGVAAINAGFFTPEGKPLGIVIDDKVKRGSFNRSSLGSGMYYTTASGAKITRSRNWSVISKSKPQHLLQSGPMLIEHSSLVKGLSTKNSRVRSFIATDNKNHWMIGHASECTLSELSKALETIKIPNFTIRTALNLDGGRSSDLWVASSVTGGAKTVRRFWNKPVRNFLILKKK